MKNMAEMMAGAVKEPKKMILFGTSRDRSIRETIPKAEPLVEDIEEVLANIDLTETGEGRQL
jgi:hypothetical protein